MTTVSQSRTTGRQPPDYLSAQEIDGLLSVVDDVQSRVLFQIEWRAGFRVSEALHLQVRDVNLRGDRPCLRVTCGKGGTWPPLSISTSRLHCQGRPPVFQPQPHHGPPPPA